MSTIMRFNITDEVGLAGADATINAENAGPVDSINLGYDVALILLANGLTGTYKQVNGDMEDINSNLEIASSEWERGRMLYVSGTGAANLGTSGRTAYGNDVGAGLRFGTGAISSIQLENGDSFDVVGSNFASEKIGTDITPLGNQDRALVNDAGAYITSEKNNEIGHGLKHVVAAAMFKDLGKTAALINEDDFATSLQSTLYTALNSALETDAGYDTSKVYKQYLGTGRYGGADPNFNGSETYNLNDTVVNFVVNISGNVADEDGGVTMTAAVVNGLFGDSTASETKVTGDGSYSISAWVQWFNDDRF